MKQDISPHRATNISQLQLVATQAEAATRWAMTREQAHCEFARKLKVIRKVAAEGRNTRNAVRSFFKCDKVRLSAAIRQVDDPRDERRVRALAKACKSWALYEEPVRWRNEPKKSGGYRMICTLPPKLKAQHFMIGKVIAAQTFPEPALFGTPDWGHVDGEKAQQHFSGNRDDAVKRVRQLILDGYSYVAEYDIQSCFENFNLKSLAELSTLKIPKEVITHTLNTRLQSFHRLSMGVLGSYEPSMSGQSGPRGLMQGSPASSAILAWNLNRVMRDLTTGENVQIVCVFDNFVVASRDEPGLRETHSSLAAHLRSASFGPLTLSDPNPFTSEGFNFLGYHLSTVGEISISDRGIERLTRRLCELEETAGHVPTPALLHDKVQAVLDFVGGYREATSSAEQLEFITSGIARDTQWVFGLDIESQLRDEIRAITENQAAPSRTS